MTRDNDMRVVQRLYSMRGNLSGACLLRLIRYSALSVISSNMSVERELYIDWLKTRLSDQLIRKGAQDVQYPW